MKYQRFKKGKVISLSLLKTVLERSKPSVALRATFQKIRQRGNIISLNHEGSPSIA